MAPIRVHLLGGFLLESEGQNLPPIPSAVGRSLFAYLVTHRARRHTRDLLAGTFWPELPESRARRRLSQALWQIQAVLQEAFPQSPLIDSTGGDVRFRGREGEYWLDVAEFDRHLADATRGSVPNDGTEARELEAAVGLYRGEFLAGFYEDWTTLERERLRTDYLSALDRLIGIHKSRADYETALSFAKRLSLHDPLRESAHREVMRLCFLLGRSNEALRQYELCAATLADELGTEPSTQTEALRVRIAQLRSKGEQPFAPTFRSPLVDVSRSIPLVGRDDERALILHRMEEAILGRGGVVFIEGRSGTGKTRLVEQLADDAQWRGLSVLHAECIESEVLHPFGALRRALTNGLTRLRFDQLEASLGGWVVGDLARLVPHIREWMPTAAPAGAGVESSRQRLDETLESTLLGLAELNPILLLIDDVQWIDDESMAVFADIAQHMEKHGLLLCLSFRTSGARERAGLWSRLRTIDSVARVERIHIEPFEPPEVARLIEESLGVASVGAEVVEGLFLETGGNPLFILESLRAWHERLQTEVGAGERLPALALAEDLPVAGGVAQVIRRRLGDLAPEIRTALEAAAVIGGSFDPGLLASSAGLSRGTVVSALEQLMRKGALREGSHGYEFTHDQIRKVIMDGLSHATLRRTHAAVARSMRRHRPDSVENLAYHFTEAKMPAEACRYSIEAGRRARALGAYDTAVNHFERAASWGLHVGRYALLCEWEDTLDVLGRRDAQHAVLTEMAQFASSSIRRADLARRRSRLLARDGNIRDAIEKANLAVAELGGEAPRREYGRMVQNLGLVLSQAGHPREAISHLEAAVEALGGDGTGEAAALCDLGNVLCDAQEYERAATALTRALARYEEIEDPHGMAETMGQLAIVRMEQGDGEAASELYTGALRLSRELNYRRGEAVNLANLGNALYFQGAVGEALRRYEQAAEVFASIGDRRGAALLRSNAASVRHTIVGDSAVEADVRESLAYFEAEGHEWGQAFCHEHLAAIAHRRGDADGALGHIRAGLQLASAGGHRWVEVHLQRLAARIHLDLGDVERANETARQALETSERLGLDDVAPTLEGLVALIALERGEGDKALRLAREATASLDGRVEQAYVVWYDHFLVANAAGHHDEARESLATSVRLLDEVLGSLSPGDRERAQRDVPEHRSILAARDRTFTRSIAMELPRLGVPLGRPLRLEDLTTVSVTVSDPDDFALADDVARRRVRLQRMVDEAEEQGATIRVRDLAEVLDVSVATIRRDLAGLRRAGVQVRTRGTR